MAIGNYDNPRCFSRKMAVIGAGDTSGGISIPGTAASATEIFRIPITDSITVDKAKLIAMTGGTAAGPTLTLCYSLAGTGAVTPFGTCAFGTNANNAVLAVTIATAQAFVSGDALIVRNEAGTAASTPKIVLTIGFVETFPQ